ncbi:CAP GLY and/or SCP-1 domain containing protein [Asbolus verrucosus]|uniref:CAP GLY and/or SCP-1 domain containing protein n=1 Tax=Asbolus verrucosus TaxID=1661398 RepID=A0A482VKD1_ASBVE|nr:CAP GLY and/or SCP-1 domain containing protein [Asbolus verrucosus]
MEIGGALSKQGPCLDTVRALHQTVVALRAALEQSRTEILELKTKSFPLESVEQTLRTLSLENHVLKTQLVDQQAQKTVLEENEDNPTVQDEEKKLDSDNHAKRRKNRYRKGKFEAKISIKSIGKASASLESLLVLKSPTTKKLSVSKTVSFSNLSSLVDLEPKMNGNNNESREEELQSPQNELEQDQDQEVDDIELIFTTDETKESDFKEQLVSIDAGESNTETANLLQCPVSDLDQNLDVSDRELDDDVFNDNGEVDFRRENSQLYNSKSDNSINQEKSLKSCYSYQDSSFENKSLEKDESFDRFEERIRIVETDISKCGIQEVEYGGLRRNTCPNPLQYRPLLHREALSKGSRKTRPILAHSNAVRKDSGAQTDISALPGSSWLSESNLVNKARAGENFTTLPSKFPLPGSRLRLSEKTVEARRVLLSDIGFTSMVPELSRSADHLCPVNIKAPVVTTYGQFLKTSDFHSPGFTSQKFTWTTTTATPSEGSYSQSRYNSMYPLASPPMPSRRCSAPVSPSRKAVMKPATSRVRFANGSLPELRGDWTLDSGDSTDSLVEEAENYLRRSIDCIVTTRDYGSERKKSVLRRASAPEPSGDNVPPQGWQPFLPRVPRDLKPDHWVKVITPEGRVRGGRVRYIGPVVSQSDQFVGVQLGSPDGHSDGTFNARRYFQCEPYHGIFVPFKKVIMGWRP